MRTLLTIVLSGSIAVTANAQADAPTRTEAAMITFETQLHDYGTIAHDANGECTFKYTNTGNAPLVIIGCKSSCGCVVPKCGPNPLLPGKSSVVWVKYDTKRSGPFTRSVTVESNATNTPVVVLRIKGHVLPPVEEMPSDTTHNIDH